LINNIDGRGLLKCMFRDVRFRFYPRETWIQRGSICAKTKAPHA